MAAKTPATLKRQARETSGGTSEKLIPQPHGGALLPGGVPGHKGAGGRPRNEVRALLLEGAEVAIPKLRAQLDSDDTATVRNAAEAFLKYGVGTVKEISVENVRTRVQKTLDVIRKHVSPEQMAAMTPELRQVWA